MKYYKIFFSVALFVMSCRGRKEKCYNITSNEILAGSANRIFIPKGNKDRIIQLIDKGKDSTKGGVYVFDSASCLVKYAFFQNLKVYTYREEYDQGGNIINRVGKIFVDMEIKRVNIDSAFIQVYLFSLKKNFNDVQFKLNSTPTRSLKTIKDTLYTNMRIVNFGINTKGLENIKLYLFAQYQEERTATLKSESDTVYFIKNPELEFDTINIHHH